jgi:FMN phosphatase YigB (HAD superfamily)
LHRIGLARLVSGTITSAELGREQAEPGTVPPRADHRRSARPRRDMVGNSVAEDVDGARAAGVAPVLLVRGGAAPADLDGVP